MKKLILFFGVFTTMLVVAQSTPVSTSPMNKNVLLEELTGIHCGFCPDGHQRANALKASHPGRVVLVNVHAGGYAIPATNEPDLRTTDGNALDSWFNPAGYPAGTVQRRVLSNKLTYDRDKWNSVATTVLAETSPVNIALDAEIDLTTREATVYVEIFYTSPFQSGTNHYLNVGILQNNFEGPQHNYGSPTPYNPTAILPDGNYMHQHIFRGYINSGGTWGKTIDASQTQVIYDTIKYTLPASINSTYLDLSNLEFFAFVGEGHNGTSNSKVFTAAEITPTLKNIPASGYAHVNGITNFLNAGCDSPATVIPSVKISNGGKAITSMTFSTVINGGTPTITNWTGNIPQFETQVITLDNIDPFVPAGTNSLKTTLTAVNGGDGLISTSFTATKSIKKSTVATGSLYEIDILTDYYAEDNSWELLNSANTVVASGGPYKQSDGQKIVKEYVTLNATDCYSFKMYDAVGDGMGEGSNPGGGFGFRIKKGNSTIYSNISTLFECKTEEPDKGGTSNLTEGVLNLTYQFEVGLSEINNSIALNVYPNPSVEKVHVTFNAENSDYTINVTDLAGRVLKTVNLNNLSGYQDVDFSLSGIANGNYILSVVSENGTVNQQIIINQ